MSVATAEKPLSSGFDSGYVSVRISTLQSVKTAAVDLFVRYERNADPVLYCRAGSRLSQEQYEELAEAGVDKLYVRSGDFETLGSDLRDSLESFLQREDVSQPEKFSALQSAFAVEIEQSLRVTDCGRYREVAEKVGRELVELLAASDVLPRDLFRLARHDFNTFSHVTNVSSYALILAEQLGLRDKAELEQIATGAMLHDVGKRFIPHSILTKPSRLDPEERAIIETHPLRGYVELCDRPGLNFAQLMMVYQHHERIDGKGYPVAILGDEIHPWAKLLAVVDVFDAMTAKRPYRRPATAEEVLEFQQKQAGTQFDREMVQCWISAMSKE